MSADNLHQDLSFVRSALESSQQASSPASIYLLWAAISVVGFPLNDVAPGRAPWFWLIASPRGLFASLWLGRRHALQSGQLDQREAWTHGLHWLGLLPVSGRGRTAAS